MEKEKLCSSEDMEGGGAGADGTRGGVAGGVSASLTPAIWDKTIPYDGETFHLEYMDLDEFLLENGIPVSLEEEELQKTLSSVERKGKPPTKVTATTTAATTTAAAAAAPPPPASATVTSDPEETVTVTTLQPAKLEEEDVEEEDGEEEEQEEECETEETTAEVQVKKEKTSE